MKHDWWNRAFRHVVVMGDSITFGALSSSPDRCWAAQLVRVINEFQRSPATLTNLGIGANVISTKSAGYLHSGKPAASERIDSDVLSLAVSVDGGQVIPDLLILAYGLNDARCGTPIDVFCSEMKDIVSRIRQRIQPVIVLTGPYYMYDFALGAPEWGHGSLEQFHSYNQAIESVADDCDCLFANLLESYRQANWMVSQDGCHPNDLGHRIVANKIFEVLASNCSGLAKQTKEMQEP